MFIYSFWHNSGRKCLKWRQKGTFNLDADLILDQIPHSLNYTSNQDCQYRKPIHEQLCPELYGMTFCYLCSEESKCYSNRWIFMSNLHFLMIFSCKSHMCPQGCTTCLQLFFVPTEMILNGAPSALQQGQKPSTSLMIWHFWRTLSKENRPDYGIPISTNFQNIDSNWWRSPHKQDTACDKFAKVITPEEVSVKCFMWIAGIPCIQAVQVSLGRYLCLWIIMDCHGF